MRKVYLVISGVAALACCLLLLLPAKPIILVKKTVSSGVRPGAIFYVNVHCEDRAAQKKPLAPRGLLYLEYSIDKALKSQGFSRSVVEDKSEYIIECSYRNGWCLPYPGRHWDIYMSAIYSVELKLVDQKTGLVIGELIYKRSHLRGCFSG